MEFNFKFVRSYRVTIFNRTFRHETSSNEFETIDTTRRDLPRISMNLSPETTRHVASSKFLYHHRQNCIAFGFASFRNFRNSRTSTLHSCKLNDSRLSIVSCRNVTYKGSTSSLCRLATLTRREGKKVRSASATNSRESSREICARPWRNELRLGGR